MNNFDMDPTGYDEGVWETCEDVCKIIFEGEDTEIGRNITIDRIKDCVNYKYWLTKENDMNPEELEREFKEQMKDGAVTITTRCDDYPSIESMQKELQYQSFRVIRQYVNDFTHDDLSNDEIAGFVKGVCNLESEISKAIDKQLYKNLNDRLEKF